MWVARKRIQLWYTARNLLAIFYALQVAAIESCQTLFDDIQSKALTSPSVIVGKITGLDTSSQSASMQILHVLKEPSNGTYRLNNVIKVYGFLPLGLTNNPKSQPSTAQSKIMFPQTSLTDFGCLSYVNVSKEYIVFINQAFRNNSDIYRTVYTSLDYNRNDRKLIKNILCQECASPPNAKSKRNLEITEGTIDYRITCRVTGSPPPDVRWLKDGQEINSALKGVSIKIRRKKDTKITLRFKKITLDHAGLYQCTSRNVLGTDTAKTKLTVASRVTSAPTPPNNVVDEWQSIDVDDDIKNESPEEPSVSHYIPCTGRDKDYCLHGGECRVFPDGRYKHCRCLARFTGSRCEEANVQDFAPSLQSPVGSIFGSGVELANVVTVLISILVVLVVLLLLLAFYCGGWRYSRRKARMLEKKIHYQKKSEKLFEEIFLLDEVDGRRGRKLHMRNMHASAALPIKQCNTMATQTEPEETSLQKLRSALYLDLQNHFPQAVDDVVLRKKNGNNSKRPASNPVEPRPRQRLSGTSTLTENKNLKTEFETVIERVTPTETVLDQEQHKDRNQGGPQHPPTQANCDKRQSDCISRQMPEKIITTADMNRNPIKPIPGEKCAVLHTRGDRGHHHHLTNGSCT